MKLVDFEEHFSKWSYNKKDFKEKVLKEVTNNLQYTEGTLKVYDNIILENLYSTRIEAPSTFEIDKPTTIKIILKDYNDNPIKNKKVDVYVDNEKINMVPLFTNEDGSVDIDYTPKKWGLHTIHCNDNHTIFRTRGWRVDSQEKERVITNMYYCEDLAQAYVSANKLPTSTNTEITIRPFVNNPPDKPSNSVVYWGGNLHLSVVEVSKRIYVGDFRGSSWTPSFTQIIPSYNNDLME